MKNTARPIVIILLSIAVLFCIPNTSYSQQTAGQVFEKALYLEEATGDLEQAMALYQQILEEFPDNREIAAKSLLHLGICYEKQGLSRANGTYQEVINKYPDRPDEVTLARERLNRLLALQMAPAKPSFRKIKIPTKLSWSVSLSPDGNNLALVSDKKIWIMPLRGNLGADIPGKPIQLNTEGIEVEWTGLSWSGDGNWIAFNEIVLEDKQTSNQSIYIVPSKGGKPKKIIENYRDARVVNYRLCLSPDGKSLAFSSVEDRKQYIQTIAIDGGKPRKLLDMQAREPVFSPDGKMIAFVEDKKLGSHEGDLGLWIVPANGGIPELLANAGNASSPVWSPDGKMIAFLDYSDGKKINIVTISEDGESSGKVLSIDAPEGTEEVRLLAGWIPDNKIGALLVTRQEFALYTVPAEGGQAAMVLNDCYALQPRWSRDGKQIYFITPPKEGENRMYRLECASVPAAGGVKKSLPKDRDGEIVRQLAYQGGNRVSPDGKMIVSAAWTPGDTSSYNFPKAKIWKKAVDGTESIQLTNNPGPYADLCPSWSPDGKKVVFLRTHLRDGIDPFGEAGIYIINSSGGEAELLTSESGKWVNSINWSPDGKSIAYLISDKEPPHQKALKVINVDDGISSIVGEIPAANVNIEIAWSPDSKRIAFNDIEGEVIKIISLDDGNIDDIETNLVDVKIYHLDWSPDGKQFVFGGWKGGEKEFWLMENFLPLVEANK